MLSVNWAHFFIFSRRNPFWTHLNIFGHLWPTTVPPTVPQSVLKVLNLYCELNVESAKKRTLIIDSVHFFDLFSFMVISGHFGPLGRPFGGTNGPLLRPNVFYWSSYGAGSPVLGGQWAKKCSFIIIVLFLAFCALKSRSKSAEVLTPFWGPKHPQGPHMDWYP